MRIAIVAEGCYPYVTGGVSTWCDQLIRGLDEHVFDVVAITAMSRNTVTIDLPPNVESVTAVPLWEWTPTHSRMSQARRREFLARYRTLLSAMLDPGAVQRGFDLALREMFFFAQSNDLSLAFQGDEVVEAMIDCWARTNPSVGMSVADALHATELVEHMLLPMSAPVPRADICHPVSNGLPSLIALGAKWAHGTPLVMSEHGVYLRERYLSAQSVLYNWPVKSVMLSFMRRMCRTAYQEADLIVPVNVFNRRWEVRHGADPDRIQTIYNGVAPATLPLATDEPAVPTVGWVGRVDPLKDLATLVTAFAIVRQEIPDAVLRLFGPIPVGNEVYADSIRAVIAEHHLEDCVTLEGPIRPVNSAYHASTVVALSSISEGLPYTVMEAMMCGRATVSSDVGGVAEVTGDAGLVVPPRDPAALGEALVALLRDDARRHDMASRARARAMNMFQLDTMLDTYRQAYEEVLEEARSRASVAGDAPMPMTAAPTAEPPAAAAPMLPRPSSVVSPLRRLARVTR